MTELPRRFADVLDGHQTMVIATVSSGGEPAAASVFYAPIDVGGRLELACALLSSSSKLAHLRTEPRSGIYIGPRAPTIWIQGTAIARIVDDAAEREQVLGHVMAHAPGAATFIERVPVTAVVFAVTRLKLTDLTGGQPPVLTVQLES